MTTLVRTAFALLVAATLSASCGHERTQLGGERFLVYTRHLNTERQAIWIARTDGTHARQLAPNALFGALSPDGRWVVYDKCLGPLERCLMGNAPLALYLVATSGGNPRLLAHGTSYPTWSPRSDRIVAENRDGLISLDLAGKVTVLEESRKTAGWSFSPDGKWIVYAKLREHPQCASDLFVVRATGGHERQLTRGRDILPVWGRHWIAFSRYPKTCAYARRIWRIRPNGSDTEPVTGVPPGGGRVGAYYGFDPIEWTPDERALLAGLSTEWGPQAIRIDAATGAYRRLSGYALDLSRDGRFALVDSGGVEGPHTVAAVALEDGRRQVLAHGDVVFPSWNR